MSLRSRILVILLLQTLALAGMVGMKHYTLATGAPVVLKTAPVDPRSLFSGDYVRLEYDISRVTTGVLGGDTAFAVGDAVYVLLEPRGEYWEPVSLHREHPSPEGGRLAIKGRVLLTEPYYVRGPGSSPELHTLHVKYGIENYYVPEGEGRVLERPMPGDVVSIRVVVDRFGNPGIKAVLVNGQERYVETLW